VNNAPMMELVDITDLKSVARERLQVRLLLGAPLLLAAIAQMVE
jgi:hypothetical protein